jgi:hypothetical protein
MAEESLNCSLRLRSGRALRDSTLEKDSTRRLRTRRIESISSWRGDSSSLPLSGTGPSTSAFDKLRPPLRMGWGNSASGEVELSGLKADSSFEVTGE